ncbi:MAG: JAB domain-containing protein [Opitutales bacterium]
MINQFLLYYKIRNIGEELLREPTKKYYSHSEKVQILTPFFGKANSYKLILRADSIADLSKFTNAELKDLAPCNLSDSQINRFRNAISLHEVIQQEANRHNKVSNAHEMALILKDRFKGLDHEEMHAAYFDADLNVLGIRKIAEGNECSVEYHPRDIYSPAVELKAAYVAVAHNHPSGTKAPSPADLENVKVDYEAGELLGIKLHDHFIFDTTTCEPDRDYFSIRRDSEIDFDWV